MGMVYASMVFGLVMLFMKGNINKLFSLPNMIQYLIFLMTLNIYMTPSTKFFLLQFKFAIFNPDQIFKLIGRIFPH